MDGNEREKLLNHGDAAQRRRRVGARLKHGRGAEAEARVERWVGLEH